MGPENDSKHFLFCRYELVADDGRRGNSYGQEQKMTSRNVSGMYTSVVALVSIFAGRK
jgi:hypothetical protein